MHLLAFVQSLLFVGTASMNNAKSVNMLKRFTYFNTKLAGY